MSVLLVAGGLFYTNRANRNQLGVAVQGQVADRFSAAIEQLGQEGRDKLSIRLGGIYSLQRLMRDSAADEPAIVEVLCAFIRTHAAKPDHRPQLLPPSPVDIRAAVSVLAFRPGPLRPANSYLDLSSTLLNLDGANLVGASLRGVDLIEAAGEGTDLRNADLAGAYLEETTLGHTELDEAATMVLNSRPAAVTIRRRSRGDASSRILRSKGR